MTWTQHGGAPLTHAHSAEQRAPGCSLCAGMETLRSRGRVTELVAENRWEDLGLKQRWAKGYRGRNEPRWRTSGADGVSDFTEQPKLFSYVTDGDLTLLDLSGVMFNTWKNVRACRISVSRRLSTCTVYPGIKWSNSVQSLLTASVCMNLHFNCFCSWIISHK